jgi:hypothetical protein
MRLKVLAAATLLLSSTAAAQTAFSGFDVSRLTPTNARAAEAAFLASLTTYGTETFAGDVYANPLAVAFA